MAEALRESSALVHFGLSVIFRQAGNAEAAEIALQHQIVTQMAMCSPLHFRGCLLVRSSSALSSSLPWQQHLDATKAYILLGSKRPCAIAHGLGRSFAYARHVFMGDRLLMHGMFLWTTTTRTMHWKQPESDMEVAAISLALATHIESDISFGKDEPTEHTAWTGR